MNCPIKPYFYAIQPDTFIVKRKEISRIEIWGGEKIEIPELEKDQVIYFDKDDDDDCYLVVYRETEVPNPYYESELIAYNKAKATYDVQMVEYQKQIAAYEEEQRKQKIEREKAEFERLKKIYG